MQGLQIIEPQRKLFSTFLKLIFFNQILEVQYENSFLPQMIMKLGYLLINLPLDHWFSNLTAHWFSNLTTPGLYVKNLKSGFHSQKF